MVYTTIARDSCKQTEFGTAFVRTLRTEKRVGATLLGYRVRFPDGAPGYDNPGAACEPQVCGVGVGSLEGLASRRKYGPGIRWSRRSVSSGFPLLETRPRHVDKVATDCAEQWNGNMIDEYDNHPHPHEHQRDPFQ